MRTKENIEIEFDPSLNSDEIENMRNNVDTLFGIAIINSFLKDGLISQKEYDVTIKKFIQLMTKDIPQNQKPEKRESKEIRVRVRYTK